MYQGGGSYWLRPWRGAIFHNTVMLLKIMYFYILLEISFFSFASSELIATPVFLTENLVKNTYYEVYQQSDYHKDINQTILS